MGLTVGDFCILVIAVMVFSIQIFSALLSAGKRRPRSQGTEARDRQWDGDIAGRHRHRCPGVTPEGPMRGLAIDEKLSGDP